MPSLPWSWPSPFSAARPLLSGQLCLICRRWQHQSLCHDCRRLLMPPVSRCPRCALIMEAGREVCSLCEDYPPDFDQALAGVDYVSPWRELIARLKFRQDTALAATLAGLLAPTVRRLSPRQRPALLIPTPLSATRLRERGYNQAWLLTQALSRELRIPALPVALIRQRDTPRLMSLDADQRQQHIEGAFVVSDQARRALVGRHVAVVDDVLTTGATLNEISRTLRTAGVRSMSAWVVARTPAPHQ